jgi:hypothetical protein
MIRNIEYASSADVAYDTAIENAVSGGWGYLAHWHGPCPRRHVRSGFEDQPRADPLTSMAIRSSTAADSSDWNSAFV